MLTVSEYLNIIVCESPFLEEGLSRGIINLSALARELRPGIEKSLMKPVSESAIIMALKRMTIKVTKKVEQTKSAAAQLGDLTVRSHLSEFTYQRSQTLLGKQKKLLEAVNDRNDPFVTFTQGVYEITTIVNSDLEETVNRIFKSEKQISSLHGLAAITIRLTPETVYTPGVHYTILKQLAWNGINIVEVVSTYTEFTIILNKEKVDVSFSVLMKLLSNMETG